MSQFFNVGASFYFIIKKTSHFSKFHKIRTRTYIKTMSDSSPIMIMKYAYTLFLTFSVSGKRDIFVQKIFGENLNF